MKREEIEALIAERLAALPAAPTLEQIREALDVGAVVRQAVEVALAEQGLELEDVVARRVAKALAAAPLEDLVVARVEARLSQQVSDVMRLGEGYIAELKQAMAALPTMHETLEGVLTEIQMAPDVGLIVQFRLPDYTRADGREEVDRWRAALITRVWNDDCVNLLVYGDPSDEDMGHAPVAITSVVAGDGPGRWRWIPVSEGTLVDLASQAPELEASPA